MRVVRYALAVVVIAIAPQAARAAQPDAKAQAAAALHDAQSFLGTGSNADGWKNYLGLAALDRELQRTGPVDIPAVAAVLTKLNSGAKGLDLPALVKLRKSVAAWVDELNLPGPEALGDAVKDAASQFHPIGSLDIEQARTELQKKAAELNAFFAPQGANGAAWQKYLLLSDLQVQAKPAVDADRDLLAKIAARFDADKPGLELSQVRATAAALGAYRELVAAAATEGLNTQYEAEIKSLGEWLAKYVQAPGEENAAEVNQRLAWLRRMHQAGGLVRAIRRAFDRPNVYVAAKSNIVGAGIERSIDDVSPLVDNINGTQINGTGHTVGQLKVELVPNSDRAVLDIMLVGTTYSNTVGQNGPATIYSQGTTQIGGRKRVLIDALGIRDLPATAAAVTKTRVTGVAAGRPGGLINNIAQQKVAEGKGQAELVASDHAAARVRTRLNKEAANDLGRAARDFQEKFRNPLIRQHLYPSVFDFSTTRDLLHVTMLEADDSQLGAPGAPPALDESAYDLAVRFHESAANNLATQVLAGVTLHDEDVRKKIIEMRGSLPDQFKDQDDQEPWSITFEKFRPVSVSIRDGGFEIVIRGKSYTTGEKEQNKYGSMYVTARYKTEQADLGYRMVRQGELMIEPPTQGQQSIKVVTLKTILKKKFAKLLPETIEPKGLELPGKWKNVGKLFAAHVQTDGGWAVVGYRQASPAEANVASRPK